MEIDIHPESVTLHLCPLDAWAWSRGQHTLTADAAWPCSKTAGIAFHATFDRSGLVDVWADDPEDAETLADVGADEFNAITSDFLALKLPADHPAHFAAVGQFAA